MQAKIMTLHYSIMSLKMNLKYQHQQVLQVQAANESVRHCDQSLEAIRNTSSAQWKGRFLTGSTNSMNVW